MAALALARARAEHIVLPPTAATAVTSLGTAPRYQEGAMALPVFCMAIIKECKFSLQWQCYVLRFPTGTRAPKTVRVETGELVVPYTIAGDGSYMDVHVAHEKYDDPSGQKDSQGRVKSLECFHRLTVPHRIAAQMPLRVMVNGKNNPPLHQCVKLANVLLGPFEPTEAAVGKTTTTNKKAAAGAQRAVPLSVKAGGHVPLDNVPDMTDWPLLDRLRYALPYVHQLLPTTDDLIARVLPPAKGQFAVPWRAKAAIAAAEAATAAAAAAMVGAPLPPPAAPVLPVHAAADTEEEAAAAAGMLPTVRIEAYTFNTTSAFALPNESYQLAATAAPQGLAEVTYLGRDGAPPSYMVRGNGVGDPKDNKFRRPRMGGTHVLSVTVARALDTGAPTFATLGAELTLWAEHLVNAPSWFLPLNEAICRGTAHRPPVPFVLLASVHRERSLAEQRHSPAFPDGLLTLMPQTPPLFRLRDHVLDHAIEVSGQTTLDGRFGKGVQTDGFVRDTDEVLTWYNDALEGKSAKALATSSVRYDMLKNVEGCVLLDMLMGSLPKAPKWPPGTRFFALPLYSAPEAPPMVARDGPAEQLLPADRRPRRIAFASPAEGDAYVHRELVRLGRIKAEQTLVSALFESTACMFQETPVKVEGGFEAFLPYFCFFAVTPVPAAASAVAPQPPLVPLFGQKRTRAGVVSPTAGAPEAKVPATGSGEDEEEDEEGDDSRETVDGGPRADEEEEEEEDEAPLLGDADFMEAEMTPA